MAAVSAGISIGTAVKTLAESGGSGLANMEKMGAKTRFIGGGLKQVGRGVGALSAGKQAAKGKTGREAAETKTRVMEAGTSMWSEQKGMSGKQGTITAQQTGAGTMTHLPGGGAVRSGDIVSSGGGFWGNMFGTMGTMVLVIMTQSTIGRVVDGYLYLGNRKGMMERLGITKYEKRMAQDLKAAEELGVNGVRVTVEGTTHVVKSATVDADGNTVYVIESPSSKGEAVTRQITLDEKGNLVGMSYQMTLTKEQAQQLPGYKEGQVVNVSITDAGSAVISDPRAAQLRNEPFLLNSQTDQVLFNSFTGPAYEGGAGGFTLGTNLSNFQNTYNENRAVLSTVIASAGLSASIASMHSGNDIESTLKKDPESRQIVADIRREAATQALVGIVPGILDEPGGPKHLQGVKGESSEYGERGAAEQATVKVNAAYGESRLGDLPKFSETATKSSGLEGTPNASAFSAALTAVASSSNAGELQGMSETNLRGAVRQEMIQGFVQQGMPVHMAEARADAAIGSANMGAVTQQVNAAGSGLIQNFREQGFNQAMVGALSRADLSQVQQVAGTGGLMADDKAVDLVARAQTTDYRFDPDTARAVNQHKILTQEAQYIQGMQGAVDGGNFTLAGMHHQQAIEVQNIYWHAKADSAVAKDPEVPQQKETVMVGGNPQDLTIAEQAETGTLMAFQGTRMMHRMQSPGMETSIQQNVQQETEARSLILAEVNRGNAEQAKLFAQQRADFYEQHGNTAGAETYRQVAAHISPNNPGASQAIETTFSQAPHADALAIRTAAVQAEARREQERSRQATDLMASGDYSTARHVGVNAYTYHREQGNEAEAQKWLSFVEQTHQAQTGKPKDPAGKAREILDVPEYKPPEPPPNFNAMPETKQEPYIKQRVSYNMEYDQKAKESQDRKLQPAQRTYDRAVQYAGEGYGHIIDAADRAGRYSQADES